MPPTAESSPDLRHRARRLRSDGGGQGRWAPRARVAPAAPGGAGSTGGTGGGWDRWNHRLDGYMRGRSHPVAGGLRPTLAGEGLPPR